MGHWGDKTYESDYIEEIISDFELIPDMREASPLKNEEIIEILENEDSEEVYLGIVSFLISTWKSPDKFLSKEVLERALLYAENLLKDSSYASRWLFNWNERVEALREEMELIHELLNPLIPFDFSRYEKVNQESLFDLDRWDSFNEDHQFDIIENLSRNPKREAVNILKKDISKFKGRNNGDVPSRLVLAALALLKIEGEDAIEIIFENINNSFPWVKQRVKVYFNQLLIDEVNDQVKGKIEDLLNIL